MRFYVLEFIAKASHVLSGVVFAGILLAIFTLGRVCTPGTI